VHYGDDYPMTTTRLPRREREHDGFQAAHFTRSNNLKDCTPGTRLAGNAGATYRYW
jgi:hypothetical protein